MRKYRNSAGRTNGWPRTCARPRSSSTFQKSGRAVGVASAESGPRGEALMDTVTHLAPAVGVAAACDFLGVARASCYRQRPVLGPLANPAPQLPLAAQRPTPAR